MKNKFLVPLLFALLFTFLYSCEDFIETDLSKKTITIIAPTNNVISSSYTQTFRWEAVKGAERYQLQIVKPDFSAITQFVLDSATTLNHFSYTLKPGIYQWRLRALNNSSASGYITYNLTIDSTQDLSSQQLVLLSPANNIYTDTLTQTFTWSALPTATNYFFEIYTSSNAVVPGSLKSVTTNSTEYTFAAQGTYKWRVFAQNASSSSPYSEFTIKIDTVHPVKPVPISPLNDTTLIISPVALKWGSVINATNYSVQVSDDSTFLSVTKDTTTTSTTYNFYNSATGTNYYWRVKAIRNTNESAYSSRKRFRRN